jgi:leader peptidase (prepilin peptidase)/N-methyltransferase
MELGQLAAVIFFVLGLLIGSFLNVVIHRLPLMMERSWERECRELRNEAPLPEGEAFNLVLPRSRCPKCGHAIAWYENIPVLSYAFLRGRCAQCETSISIRYPLVELSTGLLFAWCGHRYGLSATALAWSGFAAAILALALIDWDTTLLPDDITLPLLWGGLLAAQLGLSGVAVSTALWGAVAGYLSLWSIYWMFKLVTGKEGMGYGDFKLLAALGAWFGWEALIPIILMSSVIGAVVGLALKMNSKLREGGYIPFGPFLAGAGLTILVFGSTGIRRVLGI